MSAPLSPNMSRLEQALDSIIHVFKEYSADEGVKGQLTEGELAALLKNELTHPKLKKEFPPNKANDFLGSLDKKEDEQLNFGEFCGLLTDLARAYYKARKEDKLMAQK